MLKPIKTTRLLCMDHLLKLGSFQRASLDAVLDDMTGLSKKSFTRDLPFLFF
jgi:hypothetical protein